MKIEVAFTQNFWPSGRGTSIGYLKNSLEDASVRLRAPILVEDGMPCVLLHIRELGYVSLCFEEELESTLVIVDEAVDPFFAKEILNKELGHDFWTCHAFVPLQVLVLSHLPFECDRAFPTQC